MGRFREFFSRGDGGGGGSSEDSKPSKKQGLEGLGAGIHKMGEEAVDAIDEYPDVEEAIANVDVGELDMDEVKELLKEVGTEPKVYTTLNTEYVVSMDKCVAVIDRHKDEPIDDHMAVGRILSGGLVRTSHGYTPGRPGAGVSLWFDAGGLDIVTSTVIKTEDLRDDDQRMQAA